jgi:hypothetical protein
VVPASPAAPPTPASGAAPPVPLPPVTVSLPPQAMGSQLHDDSSIRNADLLTQFIDYHLS